MIKIIIKEQFTTTAHASEVLREISDNLALGHTYGDYWETIDTSEEKIKHIKSVLSTWGMTTTHELELPSSPVYENLTGKICSLIEEFTEDYVRVVTYHDDIDIDEKEIPYDELSDELIDEIHEIIDQYDLYRNKLHDSCKDEDF